MNRPKTAIDKLEEVVLKHMWLYLEWKDAPWNDDEPYYVGFERYLRQKVKLNENTASIYVNTLQRLVKEMGVDDSLL